MPDIQTFKLKYWNVVKGCQNVEFDFINTSIEDTFAFKRKNILGVLMLTNTDENKSFRISQNIAE